MPLQIRVNLFLCSGDTLHRLSRGEYSKLPLQLFTFGVACMTDLWRVLRMVIDLPLLVDEYLDALHRRRWANRSDEIYCKSSSRISPAAWNDKYLADFADSRQINLQAARAVCAMRAGARIDSLDVRHNSDVTDGSAAGQ